MIPVHPEFAERILSGEKEVEFRRRPIRESVQYVVIYATAPIKSVIGFFSVSGVMEASPDELWDEFAEVGGVGRDYFNAYFEDALRGTAIQVGEAFRLKAPVLLSSIGCGAAPPQSLKYLPDSVVWELSQQAIAPSQRR